MLEGIRVIKGIGLSSNIYVLGNEKITIIDTGVGDDRNKIIPKLASLKLDVSNITQVIVTHAHPDHTGGLTEILAKSKPKIMAHFKDASLIEDICNEKIIGLKDEDSILTELAPLKVIHTPGHTWGSICLYEENNRILFSGDTVFIDGSFGRTDLPTGDSRAMLKSLERLGKFVVHALFPGHGEYVLAGGADHIRMAYDGAKSLL